MTLRSLAAWIADILAGPQCPHCWYRARGNRSLHTHVTTNHPGWEPTT